MTRRTKVALSAAMIPIAVVAGRWLRWSRPWESPTQRAYRVCRQCSDLEPTEVDDQIIAVRLAPGTREDKLRLFREQFDDPADAEACEPCAEAVLDAVKKTEYSGSV